MKKKAKRVIQLVRVSILDALRYARYSSVLSNLTSKDPLESALTKEAHALEKGFSLPKPRRGFGEAKILDVMRLYGRLERLDPESEALSFGLGVLAKYEKTEHSDALSKGSQDALKSFLRTRGLAKANGGVIECSADAVRARIPDKMSDFFQSRHSVRDFSAKCVSDTDLLAAVRIAQCSPSACNRQAWKVYVLNGEKKSLALSLQNGNSGFGEFVNTVLIVTSPLHAFHGPLERNQAFVDGGMFAMTLIWGLHSLGLGSCALNWSASPTNDTKLRSVVGIPDSEAIIMQLAVGHLKDRYLVASSPRRAADSVVTFFSD